VPIHVAAIAVAVLTLVGLTGLYAARAKRLGRLGAIGFALAVPGLEKTFAGYSSRRRVTLSFGSSDPSGLRTS
jgi:hypothetical protein